MQPKIASKETLSFLPICPELGCNHGRHVVYLMYSQAQAATTMTIPTSRLAMRLQAQSEASSAPAAPIAPKRIAPRKSGLTKRERAAQGSESERALGIALGFNRS